MTERNASSANGASQQPTVNGTSELPKSTANLPPEALDLAKRLFDYARDGTTDALSQYLSAGIPPNLTDHAGNTLLMLAAYHGHADTVRMLLVKGADADALFSNNRSV